MELIEFLNSLSDFNKKVQKSMSKRLTINKQS